MDQKIEPLTAAEKDWIQNQLAAASEFVAAFSPDDADKPLTLGALDRAFAQWLATGETDSHRINAAINVVGVAFGQSLVEGLGLRWVIVSDEQGTELAVHGLPGKGDVLVFPQNFVAKRWDERATHFLGHSYQQIASHVESLRSETGV